MNIRCLPAKNGLVHGRMDWHSPDFYINAWAFAGLAGAAEAARRLGEQRLAQKWTAMAKELDARLARHLLPGFGNPRDPAAVPYPTGALGGHREALARRLAAWYRAERLHPDGSRKAEPRWTYFEAAQIHNALLLGLRDEAWINLAGMIASPGCWDVSAYIEGEPSGHEMLPFRNGEQGRGWLGRHAAGGNMPHNWTSAEMITLIRDLFVTESDGELQIGVGVPESWLKPGSRFGVTDLPTDLGPVTYTVTVGKDGRPRLDYRGPRRHRLCVPGRRAGE
jgi:hypothetical protein